MSPQQARGETVDFRSDQFSFGLVLYEMLTGTHPFRRETSVQTMSAIITDEARPIADISKKVPLPLRWTIERCLAKDPAGRYASTTDLARDLSTLHIRLAEVSGDVTISWDPDQKPLDERVVDRALPSKADERIKQRWLSAADTD